MGCVPSSFASPQPSHQVQDQSSQQIDPPLIHSGVECPSLYEGKINFGSSMCYLIQCLVTPKKGMMCLTLDETVVDEADQLHAHAESRQILISKLADLQLSAGCSLSINWDPASKKLQANSWEGYFSGAGAPIRLQASGTEVTWEMHPGMPFLHHFTIGGSDDARGVLERFNRHMQAECKNGQRMRLHVTLGGEEETMIGLEDRPATSVQGGLSTSANYLLILTPRVWESKQVQQQVLQAEQLGKTIVLLYRPIEQVHLPRHPTAFSPDPDLMAMEGVDLISLIRTAPEGIAELFDFMEAIPYRSHPFLERAVARHIISLAGCGASLTARPPPDPSILVAEFMDDAPVTAMHKELLAGKPVYYEGLALKQSEQNPTHMLRGYYQALLCLSEDQHSEGGTTEKQVSLDLSYSPKLNASMPQYSTTVKLSWQPINGSLVQKSPPVGVGSHWAPWTGCIEEKSASIRACEGNDIVILRPLPFLWHIVISGAAEVTVMAQVLKSALQSHAAPARVPRVSIGSGAEADRCAMIKQAACFVLILSPNMWQDEGCLSDLSIAFQTGKQILLVQDPDPRMPTHITPAAAMETAPLNFRSLFEQNDVFSMYRRWFEQQAFLFSLFQVAGLHSSIPHKYEQEQFTDIMEQKKSDLKELSMLKSGLWQYYEGFAERRGKLWGFYQIDVKFMPTQDLIELVVQFVSRSPESIPGYVAVFMMDWDQSSGDVAIREENPRWQGKLDGATGGTFFLQNKYADNLTFEPRPFVWHFFLSHIQRESSDMCGALVAKLQDLSPLGKKARVWYDQQAAAVINRDAMELGVTNSKSFILMLSPSIFKSSYVKFELQVAMQAAKRILLIYDPTPGLKHSVDLMVLSQHAPTELHAAFSSHLQRDCPDPEETGVDAHVLPFPIGDANANLQESTHAILKVVKV